jgi:hypothetical protein
MEKNGTVAWQKNSYLNPDPDFIWAYKHLRSGTWGIPTHSIDTCKRTASMTRESVDYEQLAIKTFQYGTEILRILIPINSIFIRQFFTLT